MDEERTLGAKDMNAALKWIAGVAGTALLATVGWIAVQVYEISGTVKSNSTLIAGHATAINTIKSVIPDVRVKLAKAEIGKPLKGAVLTTEPVQKEAGKWFTAVHVLDAAAGQRKTFLVPLAGRDDKKAVYRVKGVVGIEIGKAAMSFKRFEELTKQTGSPQWTPSYLVANGSFGAQDSPSSVAAALRKELQVEPVSGPLTMDLNSWRQLTKELRDKATKYRPSPKPDRK